jgi:intracellular septation protein
MAEKKINPVLKQVLELGPTILFFLIYMKIKDETYTLGGTAYSGFIVAALALIPILAVSILILWRLTGKLSRLQIFTGLAVLFFGGLTAWFNDERFFKMKTTLVYGVFAAILGVGLMRGRSYLQWVLGEALPMREEGWMILTRRLTLGFAILAVAHPDDRALGEAGDLRLPGGAVPVPGGADRRAVEICDRAGGRGGGRGRAEARRKGLTGDTGPARQSLAGLPRCAGASCAVGRMPPTGRAAAASLPLSCATLRHLPLPRAARGSAIHAAPDV